VFETPLRPVRAKSVFSDAPGLRLKLDDEELRKRVIA
jgi:hypothetical protein